MAITGRSVPNHPIILTAQGVQVVGTSAVVVSQQPSGRLFVYNKGSIARTLEPVIPGSPALGPYVFPGPNPHRITKGPILITSTEGIVPPPPGTDIEWCAQTPMTDWSAETPVTGWASEMIVTNWMASTPVEDC